MIQNISLLLLAALAGTCLLVLLIARFQAEKIIFPAPPPSYVDDDSIRKLQTDAGDTISVLYLPAETPTALLLYNHGNGEDLGHIRHILEAFQEAGISVISYDYPGYGTSTGRPTERGCYAAADAVYRHATGLLDYPADAIVLYGRSVGSGPACWLAEKYPVAGLILDSAFTSTFRVITRIKILPWDKFDNLARLPNIPCPVLILHGKRDWIIPFAHAEHNARIVGPRANTLWVDQAGHNNLIDAAGETYWTTTLNFIRNPKDHAP
ncbi:MAG: alpha/beta hydrolase [Opitutales bacterium]